MLKLISNGNIIEGKHYLTSVQMFGEINNLQKMYLLLDYVVGGRYDFKY